MNNSHNKDTVNLLWTGGWDSTFRLLQLLIIENKRVQPYYIIDFKRESTHAELRAMRQIQTEVFLKYPHTKELLLPTIFIKKSNIKQDPEITSAYHKLNETTHYGSQYDWLARFCKQFDINNIEICVQKSENRDADHRFLPLLQKIGDSKLYILNDDYINTPAHTLFRYYHFPLMSYAKVDM